MRKRIEIDAAKCPPERLLTVPEACEVLGVSRRQIDKWTIEGGLKSILVGRERRFPLWYLREFQREQLGGELAAVDKFLERTGAT